MIGGGNPTLAQAIHDANAPPPFSAALADGLLRIGCLTTEVFLAVAESHLAYKARRIREDSFESILARAAGRPPTVRLTFLSPTAFAADGRAHVLPDAGHVFGSLVRRWTAVGGPRVPELRYNEVVVTYAAVQTRKTTLEKCAVLGFTGRLSYLAPSEVAVYYHALADFAEYAGVGRRTSQGFGRVSYEQPDSARRAPALSATRANRAVPEAAGGGD